MESALEKNMKALKYFQLFHLFQLLTLPNLVSPDLFVSTGEQRVDFCIPSTNEIMTCGEIARSMEPKLTVTGLCLKKAARGYMFN